MNEKGMATLGLLILTPLLLAALAVAAAAYLVYAADGRTRHFCRVELLRHQDKIAGDLENLMRLNPQARLLRLRLAAAKAKLATAAVGSPAALAAGAELLQIQSEQAALAIQQNSFIYRARLRSRMAPGLVMSRLRGQVQDMVYSPFNGALGSSLKRGAFELSATPRASATPDYFPVARFTQTQEMHLRWSVPADLLLPTWLRPLALAADVVMQGECSATIEKENKRWIAKLSAAKF